MRSGKAITVFACAALAAATFAFTAAAGGGGGGVTTFANGSQQISSGPGVYAQTANEYSNTWVWTQDSAAYDYYWYLFRSSGVLEASGHKASGGNGSWNGAANIYYFKEYNNEPVGSARINILTVSYCC